MRVLDATRGPCHVRFTLGKGLSKLAALILVALGLSQAPCEAFADRFGESPRKPNIVFILIDHEYL